MKREELRQEFERACEIKWENSQGEPDIDYVMWLENKILAIKNNTPLPPAEGAEEISAKQVFDRAYEFYRNMENKPAIPLEAMEMIFNSMIKFATLHAQRIAEKMVSERYEIAIKALETIHHAYYTEGESAEEQVVDLRSIALKALEEIDNLKTR